MRGLWISLMENSKKTHMQEPDIDALQTAHYAPETGIDDPPDEEDEE